MKKSLIILIVLLFLSSTSFAKETVLDLSCDRNSISINETVLLTVKAENFSGKIRDIKINGIENFDIVSFVKKENYLLSNETSINLKELEIRMMPKKTGEFNLSISAGKKESQSIKIKVEPTKSKNKMNEKTTENIVNREELNNEIVNSIKMKKNYFIGEKIPIAFNIYSDRRLFNGSGFMENITIENSIIKDLEQNEAKEEQYKNNLYLKYNLRNFIITPFKAGEIIVPSIKFLAYYGFGDRNFYFTPKLKISVKELPAGKPDQFSGVVGKFDIENENFPAKIKLGDSITLKIKLKGEANFDTLEKLPVSENMLYKIYQNQKESSEKIENGKYYSEKTFEIVIIPKNSGVIEIPDIKISYFDTETQTYKFAVIKGANVTVEKNSEITETKLTNTADNNKVNPNNKEVKIELVNEKEEKKNGFIKKIVAILIGLIALLIITLSGIFVVRAFKVKKQNKESSLYKKIWK